MPTVSVVVPLYNLAGTVQRAVDSIIAQDFPDWECIIVDDGSTDGGADVADHYAERDARIHVLHQANAGLSNALNAGFRMATGEYFVILSADDAFSPRYMRRTLEMMQQRRVDIVSTNMLANGQVIECRMGGVVPLKEGNCHHYAALYKRWLFEKTGGYKPDMNPSWEDYEFWVSCAEQSAKWAHLGETLFIYYPSASGRSAEADGKDRLLRGKLEGYHPKMFGAGKGLVAVIVPCFGHEQYVREAVDSVAAQTYPHKKAVVINDCSPTWDDACLRGAECQVLHHADNRGLAAARNTGLTWAMTEWQAQYWMALDADDALDPQFIERAMGAMGDDNTRQWVYSDVQFMGDAWHTFDLKDWDCLSIGRKHQNSCSFLAPMKMYREIFRHRGYGYDEAPQLRIGYEDMEFGLACVQQGWSGKHVPGHLFKYRYHKNGSMRTRANEAKNELVRYIATRHPWAYSTEGLRMACKSCGGGKPMAVRDNKVEVDRLGAVPIGEPLKVTFLGLGTGKQSKVGASGRVYRFSANERAFIIDPRDAGLFQSGQFRVERLVRVASPVVPVYPTIQQAVQAASQPAAPPSPPPAPPTVVVIKAGRPEESVLPDLGDSATAVESPTLAQPDTRTPRGRLMALPHLTEKHVGQLWKAGIRSIKAISEASADKLEKVTGLGRKEAQEVIQHARLQRKSG